MQEPSSLELLEVRVTSFFAGTLVLATLDTFCVELRGGAGVAFRYWLSTVAAAFWVALLLGGTTTALTIVLRMPASALRSRFGRSSALLVSGASWGLAAGLCALLLLRVWDLGTDPYQLRFSVPLLFTGAGLVASYLWDRLSLRSWLLLSASVCLSCFAVDALVLRGLYLGVHNTVAFVAIVAAALASIRLHVRLRAFPLLGVLAVVAQLGLFSDMRAVRSLGVSEGTLQPKLFRLLHALSDRDRDGYSSILGGGDCDDGNADRRPGRCEIASNGIDDNCNDIVDGIGPAPLLPPNLAGRHPVATTGQLPHVYIVVSDALRGDYGRMARSEIAPEIDAYAAESLDFSAAYTPYPSTFRALIATLQGRAWRHVGPTHPTLFRVLAERGYDVRLWIANQRLTERPGEPGIVDAARRQDPFKVPTTSAKADWTEQIIDEAIEELGSDAGPRLRWLHLLDTHSPCMRASDGDSPLDCYRREIRHTSRAFGRLWSALQKSQQSRGAVVIFIADHGEEFGDHSGSFHGSTLFEESTRVPMIMHLPGVSPARIDAPSSLIDLPPTLLGYLGVPPTAGHMGFDHLSGAPAPLTRVLSEVESLDNLGGLGLPALQMARAGQHKLVLNISDNLVSFYDLRADPGEQDDVYAQSRREAAPLLDVIHQWQELGGCREP